MDETAYRCALGRRIVTLRKHYGLSRKSLAMLIGMPVGRLRRVEAGDVSPKVYDFHLKRLSRVFGITVDELLAD